MDHIDKKLSALAAVLLFGVAITTGGSIGVQPAPKHGRHAIVHAPALRHATAERKIAPLEFEENDKAPSTVLIVDASEIIPSGDVTPQPNGLFRASVEFRIAPHLLQPILQL